MIRYEVPLHDPRFGKLFPCPQCEAPARAQRLQARLAGQSGLLPDEIGLTLDDIFQRGAGSLAMINAVREMLEKPFGFLTLWGGPGNGKTLALHVIVSQFVERGESAIYTRLADLLDHLRDGYNQDNKFETQERYRELIGCKLLALDEVDKPRLTEWAKEIIFTLVDDRYRYARQSGDIQRHTVLAMNINPATLPDYVYSRLRTGATIPGGFRIVQNTDPDARPSF